jgi:predicted transcriptional regulator
MEGFMKTTEQITIHVSQGFTEKLDNMAEKFQISRSTLVRNLLESGYEDAVVAEKLGIIAAIQYGRKLREYKDKILKEIMGDTFD